MGLPRLLLEAGAFRNQRDPSRLTACTILSTFVLCRDEKSRLGKCGRKTEAVNLT